MNGRKLAILTGIAGVLALGEVGSAVMIWLEKYPDSMPLGAVAFAGFFLIGAWLLRSRRATSGSVLIGLLCLFEVVSFSGWTRHSTLDWIYQTSLAVVSLAGLVVAIAMLADRIRHRAAA